ncbi:hypothetical protein [Methanomassiliicoccus luminyensis]|jgi:hypothetical protein|uniref:hypothetical protein n=1 Tax=Methanomassiliicoccus luminyensis TaxID=1080712 RepID=UPI000375FC29|nr:hypothetical protein [Methanomassiliicoccus luminyensis]
MAQKPKKILYQSLWDGRIFKTKEEAENSPYPYQVFMTGHDRYPKRGFFGTVAFRKKGRFF